MQKANVSDWIAELQRATSSPSTAECERAAMEAMLRHLLKLHERGVREVLTDTIVDVRSDDKGRPTDPEHQ
jgi:hypothetical protein